MKLKRRVQQKTRQLVRYFQHDFHPHDFFNPQVIFRAVGLWLVFNLTCLSFVFFVLFLIYGK